MTTSAPTHADATTTERAAAKKASRWADSLEAKLPERFTSKFVEDENGCWVWTASTGTHGYARFYAAGRMVDGHRFAYLTAVGPVAPGLELDHLCRVRACVNPAHLEPVTCSENKRRSPLVGRARSTMTECQNGHPYTPENTSRASDGTRSCRTCARERQRRHNAKRPDRTRGASRMKAALRGAA